MMPGSAGIGASLTPSNTDATWKHLYGVGAWAALVSAVFIPIQVVVFIAWPPPSSVIGWFTLFQSNKLIGLVDLDLLLIADNVLLIPIFLALYVALRRVGESVMAIATALGFVGVVLFIASNPAFDMLSLSNQYAAATTDAQQSASLAAGQAMLATWQGTAFQVAYVLGSVAGITIGAAMLRSRTFGRVPAYMGILGNAVALGLYVPTIGVYISVFSVVVSGDLVHPNRAKAFRAGSNGLKEENNMSVQTIKILIAGALLLHGLGHGGAIGALVVVQRTSRI